MESVSTWILLFFQSKLMVCQSGDQVVSEIVNWTAVSLSLLTNVDLDTVLSDLLTYFVL